jgi:Prokaryotic Cytochrome C oxidase subunit IV
MFMSVAKSKETVVWMVLAGLTMVSWIVGNKYGVIEVEHYKYMSGAMFVLAFFKIRLVIMHFMEIAHAPIPLKAIFEIWCGLFCVLLIVIFGTVTH